MTLHLCAGQSTDLIFVTLNLHFIRSFLWISRLVGRSGHLLRKRDEKPIGPETTETVEGRGSAPAARKGKRKISNSVYLRTKFRSSCGLIAPEATGCAGSFRDNIDPPTHQIRMICHLFRVTRGSRIMGDPGLAANATPGLRSDVPAEHVAAD